MQYLVQIRSQGGDREDFWPVASYLIDIPPLAPNNGAETYARSITDALTKAGLQDSHDYFATVEPLDVITGDAASARDQIVADMAEFLNEDEYEEDEQPQPTLADLPKNLQEEHRKFMHELHKDPDGYWNFNPSYVAFLQKRAPQP